MIQSKLYNVFQDKKDNFAEKFPELAFIVAGLHFKNEAGIQLDTILRYVIYFYDRRCELHSTHRIVAKAREEALSKFKIVKSISESTAFINIENEMAMRYMLWNRDNEFSVFLSASIQLENLNNRLRTMKADATMADFQKSLGITNDIFDLSEQIDTRRTTLFGDMEHIEQFAIKKELENKYKCENSMLG